MFGISGPHLCGVIASLKGEGRVINFHEGSSFECHEHRLLFAVETPFKGCLALEVEDLLVDAFGTECTLEQRPPDPAFREPAGSVCRQRRQTERNERSSFLAKPIVRKLRQTHLGMRRRARELSLEGGCVPCHLAV